MHTTYLDTGLKDIEVEFLNAYGGYLETRIYTKVSKEEYDNTFKFGLTTALKTALERDAENIAAMSGEPLQYSPFAQYRVVSVRPSN